MHARIATFAVAAGARAAVEARPAEVTALFRSQPRFLNAWFVLNEQTGEGGAFSLWGSAEAATQSARAVPLSVRGQAAWLTFAGGRTVVYETDPTSWSGPMARTDS